MEKKVVKKEVKKEVKKPVQESKEIVLDKKALEYAIRKMLFSSISESKILREKLSFDDHIKLCEWTTKLTYENLILVYLGENPKSKLNEQDAGKIRDFEGRAKTAMKYGFAGLAGGYGIKKAAGKIGVASKLPGATKTIGAAMLAFYIFRKFTDPCFRKCLGTGTLGVMGKKHKLCKYECQINAIKTVLGQLRSQKSVCAKTHNPEKCLRQLSKLEIKWAKKLQETLAKFNETRAKI